MGLKLNENSIIKDKFGEGEHAYKVEWEINNEKE
jgi:hypothetical protein